MVLADADEAIDRGRLELADASPLLSAEAHMLHGQVEAMRGRRSRARAAYQLAAQELTGVGADREVTRLWFELAAVLETCGDAPGALEAYKRGATSTGLADVAQVARSLTS